MKMKESGSREKANLVQWQTKQHILCSRIKNVRNLPDWENSKESSQN